MTDTDHTTESMMTKAEPDKRRVDDWESIASYVSTFPTDDGEGACDVQVQVGCDEESGAWFIRTQDDAGGSDESPATSYESEDDARQAAEDFAEEHDEGDGQSAEDYLRGELESTAEEGRDPEGGWRIWWDTTGSDSGPIGPRYATCAAAEAAAKLANEELSDAHPGGNLLCGFTVVFLDEDGDWRRFDPERDAYTRG